MRLEIAVTHDPRDRPSPPDSSFEKNGSPTARA